MAYDAAGPAAPVITLLERFLQVTLAQSVDPEADSYSGAGGSRASPDVAPRPPRSLPQSLAIAAMFAVGVGLVVLRRPDAVTNPQFWAEDGGNWFADAYNMGTGSLLRSYEGYLVTLPRLVALPAVHLSLQQAALLFNLVAISIQVAPAAFLVSRRFDHTGPRWVRAIVAVLYLLVPSFELNAILTNALWHMAILAVMVLVAMPPTGAVSRAFDVVVLVLTGLTGPFAALLAPVAGARVIVAGTARRWYLAMAGIVAATLTVQAWAVLHSHRDAAASLGASLKNLLFLVADRVVLPGSFGEEAHSNVFTNGHAGGAALAGLLTVAAALVVGFVLLKAGSAIRLFVLFCFATTVLSLLFPLVSAGDTNPWTVLATTATGGRYFFSAEVAWLVCVVFAASRLPLPAARWVAGAAVASIFVSGLVITPQYKPFADEHPAVFDAQLRAAAAGTVVDVPLNPPGYGWAMELTRRR